MHVYLSVWVFGYININNVFPLLSDTHTLRLSSHLAYQYESEDKKM